ncbi:MAG: hypothetical protein RMM17_00795 [Acidobacteriota bacterium]|nr:hypothetical protein [Blastocatellia bacterium]MDW8411205.1 hypothetical protein [Acidobacteriota bacterium]
MNKLAVLFCLLFFFVLALLWQRSFVAPQKTGKPAFRLVKGSALKFALSPTDTELQIDSNLEALSEIAEYVYSIRVEVLSGNRKIFERIFYEKTRSSDPGGLSQSRSTVVVLNGVPFGAKMYISLEAAPTDSALVRVSRVRRGELAVFDGSRTENVLVRRSELIAPEGVPGSDYSQVEVAAEMPSVEQELPKVIQGLLLGPRQGLVYQLSGRYKLEVIDEKGHKLPPTSVTVAEKLYREGRVVTFRNALDRPIYLQVEQMESDSWTVPMPLGEEMRYWMLTESSKLIADFVNTPRRVRLVTRAKLAALQEKEDYLVRFRCLDGDKVLLEGQYAARSYFEPFDRFVPEEIFARTEVVGTRHVAYLYLPPGTKRLELSSESQVLAVLMTEPATRVYADGSWFYFRPSNFEELLEGNKVRTIAAASTNSMRAELVGYLPPKKMLRSVEGLEAVLLRPQGLYFVEVFEPVSDISNLESYYEAVESKDLPLSITADKAYLRYSLQSSQAEVGTSEKKMVISGHTPVGKLALQKPNSLEFINSLASDEYYISRNKALERLQPDAKRHLSANYRAERDYYPVSAGQPLEVSFDYEPTIAGINIFVRASSEGETLLRASVFSAAELVASRTYRVRSVADMQAVLTNRPEEVLGQAKRFFLPLRLSSPGTYLLRLELIGGERVYVRLLYYRQPIEVRQQDEMHFWVESNE